MAKKIMFTKKDILDMRNIYKVFPMAKTVEKEIDLFGEEKLIIRCVNGTSVIPQSTLLPSLKLGYIVGVRELLRLGGVDTAKVLSYNESVDFDNTDSINVTDALYDRTKFAGEVVC